MFVFVRNLDHVFTATSTRDAYEVVSSRNQNFQHMLGDDRGPLAHEPAIAADRIGKPELRKHVP